jgi:hypothetical protein
VVNFSRVSFNPFLFGQLALAVLGMAIMTFFPRAGGAMLLVPLTSHAARELPRTFDGKTRPIAAGPVRGSFVVMADDPAWRALLFRGVLPLAASARSCGANASR